MIRRFGHPPRPDRTYRERPGAYAIVRAGRDVLVTLQDAPEREFQLPGGGIDPGESPLVALHRECLEETGWTIRVVRRLGAFQAYRYMPDYDIWARKICHVYLASPARRRGPPSEPGHDAVWMALETAAARVASPGDRAFLAGISSGTATGTATGTARRR